ncbi:MAG TPA: T9SS type A sorting domain-containing protein [Flavobacteriales bacterium]|nr:T9SS type A sorting domain-containing protein [Flavobacteriales bacterium]
MNHPVSARTNLRRPMAALALMAAPALLWAQVSLYEYSESVQPYTEVTASEAAYSLGVPTFFPPLHNMRAWVNNAFFGADGQVTNGGYLSGVYGPGYPIGFDFTYNGDVFDVIGVSNLGWISLGKSSDGAQAVWCYAGDHPHAAPFVQYIGGPDVPYKRNRIAGFASSQLRMQDQSPLDPPGPVSSLRLATLGTAPNRVFVVQYKDFRASYSSSTTVINFQIRLNEADNSVEVRYGPMVFGYQSGGGTQVGLGGRLPEDFNSRMTNYEQPAFLYDWNTTVAGLLNTDACMATTEEFGHPNGSGVVPVNGLNWKWTPDACPPPAWPASIGDLSFDYARPFWNPTAAGEYEYYVSTENNITGPEVTSGTTTDPEANLFGLEPATDYFFFVRSICGGTPGAWSLGTPFHTMGGGIVECNGGVVEETYCSHQNDTIRWLYASADGSPLRIEMLDGYVGTNSLKVWDGGAPVGNANLSISGNINGNALNALSGQIFIQLVTDNGSCESQDWYLPVHWRVGCKNCTDPLVNFAMGEVNCDQEEYFVDVNVFSMGSSTTLEIQNNLGLPSTTVSTATVHQVGPFPAGESVTLTAQNPDNMMCYVLSSPLVNEPCAIVSCAPTWYERCAQPNEIKEWLLQGDGQAISVRFPPQGIGFDADVIVYDGGDEMAPSTTVTNFGTLNNQVVTSTNPQNQLLVRYVASTYPEYACSQGNAQPFKFVAACADGCTQPQATFAAAPCTEPTTFSVDVNVTNAGSGTVMITNDAGVAATPVTGAGSYSAGPFPSGSTVRLELQGANVICTWTVNPLTKDCSNMGLAEVDGSSMSIFPNPSNGDFQLELPQGANSTEVHVLDLTGRTVAQQKVNGRSAKLQLGHLPNGLYTVVAQGHTVRYTGKISIQH